MTNRQLAKLRDDLLRLYEQHHGALSPDQEYAISTVRSLIYDLMEAS